MTVSFAVNKRESVTIARIVDRGWSIPWLRKSYASRLDLRMDITAVHANGCPLRLADLLSADDFSFAHDLSGICNCLDRDTGRLTRNFVPRYSAGGGPNEAPVDREAGAHRHPPPHRQDRAALHRNRRAVGG